MATPDKRGFHFFVMLTTVLCGGLVMVVEVLGSRVIGPYFGVSLFVWTALITVTLLSLSAGYALGGYLADRRPSPDWLYGLIMAAGVLVFLVPILKAPVIQATVPLGLRSGALLSATLLFGPALLLLGCVSPYVVRIAASEWAHLGRTVGVLYALSTVGSFVGTALAGFVIIAYVGVARAFYVCGGLLIVIGLSYLLLYRRRPSSALGLVFLLLLLLVPESSLPRAVMPDGTRVRLIDGRDGFYGSVKVVEYSGSSIQTREMMIDGLIQGGIDQRSRQSIYEYAYLLESLPFAVKPDIRSALIVGLGIGVVAERLQSRGVDVEVVDINPMVVQMAEQHFQLRLKRPVVIEDARYFLAQDDRKYDLIVMDAFTGDSTPSHLLSREALQRVRARLAPDGVLAINVIGSARQDSVLLPAVVSTLQTQFEHLAAFPLFDVADRRSMGGNVVLIAANRPVDPALQAAIADVHPLARDGVALGLRQAYRTEKTPGGLVLSDDFNPLDVLDVVLHESIRGRIIETTPASILLHG